MNCNCGHPWDAHRGSLSRVCRAVIHVANYSYPCPCPAWSQEGQDDGDRS